MESRESNDNNAPNIILITLDGVRWQEVFNGVDLDLIENKKFTKNSALLKEMFLSDDNKKHIDYLPSCEFHQLFNGWDN